MTDYGKFTESKISEVIVACQKYGDRSIVALAGVPGTGKSFIASIAAQRFTNEPLLVREIQFHQSFSYEEFIEGLRIDTAGGVNVVPGIFLEWNERAHQDPAHKYVLLIEELTRANLPAVLGELLTYIEHRDRPFLALYSRKPVRIASNLTILATYNPSDRSAIELDTAIMRRMRIIRCPPSIEQLQEMLSKKTLELKVIEKIQRLFATCAERFPDEYEHLMPFGHGLFAYVQSERPDLHSLWVEQIQHVLRRPLLEPHPFTKVIEECYPWKDANHEVS